MLEEMGFVAPERHTHFQRGPLEVCPGQQAANERWCVVFRETGPHLVWVGHTSRQHRIKLVVLSVPQNKAGKTTQLTTQTVQLLKQKLICW